MCSRYLMPFQARISAPNLDSRRNSTVSPTVLSSKRGRWVSLPLPASRALCALASLSLRVSRFVVVFLFLCPVSSNDFLSTGQEERNATHRPASRFRGVLVPPRWSLWADLDRTKLLLGHDVPNAGGSSVHVWNRRLQHHRLHSERVSFVRATLPPTWLVLRTFSTTGCGGIVNNYAASATSVCLPVAGMASFWRLSCGAGGSSLTKTIYSDVAC